MFARRARSTLLLALNVDILRFVPVLRSGILGKTDAVAVTVAIHFTLYDYCIIMAFCDVCLLRMTGSKTHRLAHTWSYVTADFPGDSSIYGQETQLDGDVKQRGKVFVLSSAAPKASTVPGESSGARV